MCLSLQGKRNNISRKDFLRVSEHFGLDSKQADNALERLSALKSSIEVMIVGSFLEKQLRDRFLKIFEERMERIFG